MFAAPEYFSLVDAKIGLLIVKVADPWTNGSIQTRMIAFQVKGLGRNHQDS